jgi:heme exporter protein CcmD
MPDFDVGKYAGFIGPAYAVTALTLAVLVWGSLNHARRWKRRFEELSGK